MIKRCVSLLWLITFLVGCSYSIQIPSSLTPSLPPPLQTATQTLLVTFEQTQVASTPINTLDSTEMPATAPALSRTSTSTAPPPAQPTPTLSSKSWRELPVIPLQISAQMRLVYEHGLASGNNP